MENNTIAKLWEKQLIKELNYHPLFEIVFTPKFKRFPKLCKIMNWGTTTHKSKFKAQPGDKIKINRI